MSDKLYNVEKILERRINNGRIEYKIKWEGYAMAECTWEPIVNLELVQDLVDEYDQAHPFNLDKNIPKKYFINKKRNSPEKEIKKKIIKEKSSEDNNIIKLDEDQKEKSYENYSEKSYKIDDSLKCVKSIYRKDGKLVASVEVLNKSGGIDKERIETDKLRKINPWILLDFYESKIKFTS